MKHTSSFALYAHLIPNHSPLPQTSCLSSLRTMTNKSSPNFFSLEFPVRFLTIEGFPSNGSMKIFNNGTRKYLCVANWDNVERTLVCQAQGYNGSSVEVHSESETNSSGNTTHSCEYVTQNCEEKINTEIKCSGIIRTFLSPQNESRVKMRMWIDTSIAIAVLTLSLK